MTISHAVAVVALAATMLACGGTSGQSGGGAGDCTSDDECSEWMSAECPGGSTTFAVCNSGTCQFEGCSSPIGTPCDDDPATHFDNENCPSDEMLDEPDTPPVDPGE